MLLGDYYDEVVKEASELEATNDVESIKVAEAIEALGDTQFENEAAAQDAVNTMIENDYAEKVAAVCEEFEVDNITFESDEIKTASAMEIVDGWEKVAAGKMDALKGKMKSAKDYLKGKGMAGKDKVVGGAKSVGAKIMAHPKKAMGAAALLGASAGAVAARKLNRSK